MAIGKQSHAQKNKTIFFIIYLQLTDAQAKKK